LAERGIFYVPDYAINIGGAMAITGMEALGWTEAEATERVTRSAEQAVRRILELSDREGVSTEEAARRLAEERLAG
ncbi:MAG: phenylalanine dehydrogenase, partial [Gemmatimonadetes bacterium]|nr:phenylalanine dehydrogenase [Gemmatimonadota bacterium]